MDDNHTDEHANGPDTKDSRTEDVAQQHPPRRKPRRRRPEGRWTNPATPLQAERFRRQLGGLQVIKAIRALCPGHAGQPCKIDVAKLSDYETAARRPGLTHIEAFCRLYQRSPEQLGLIKWREEPSTQPDATADSDTPPPGEPDSTTTDDADDPGHPQFVLVWVHDRLDSEATATASAILRLLTRDPDRDDATE